MDLYGCGRKDRENLYMDTIMEIVKNLDWTPLFISFKTGIVATVISFFLGLFAARKVIHAGERVKAIADGFLTLPMVLPPTVAGFFLLLLFSKRRPIGMFLVEQFVGIFVDGIQRTEQVDGDILFHKAFEFKS